MRRLLVAAAAAALALSFFPSPASATTYAVGPIFTYSPVAGPNGQVINVSGTCYQGGPTQSAVQVSVALMFPVRSDALPGPVDSKTITSNADGTFATTLTNNINNTGFAGVDPVDLDVAVTCSNYTVRQPFVSTSRTTQSAATIFTVPGDGPCGYGLAPTEAEAAIPCNTHLKGMDAAGAVNNLNTYVYTTSFDENAGRVHGGSVAAGEFLATAGPELAVATGPGTDLGIATGNPSVGLIHNLAPFPGFRAGVSLAFADVMGDARDELIVGAGPGGGPHVKVFTFGEAWDQVGSFYAYGENFHGGVSVAGVDVDHDGKAEIVTGAGPGGNPHVRAFKLDGTPVGPSFYAYNVGFSGGVNVASGNVTGDANEEIITATGPGGGPHVKAFDAAGVQIGPGFYAYGPNFNGGVNVAVGNADGDPDLEIVTGTMGGGDPHVRVFTDVVGTFSSGGFYAYQAGYPHGVKVAVAP